MQCLSCSCYKLTKQASDHVYCLWLLKNMLFISFFTKTPSPGVISFPDERLLQRLEYWEMIVEEMKIWFPDKGNWWLQEYRVCVINPAWLGQ